MFSTVARMTFPDDFRKDVDRWLAFVFLRRPSLEESWLFVPEELVRLLNEGGGVSVINEADEDTHLESQADQFFRHE